MKLCFFIRSLKNQTKTKKTKKKGKLALTSFYYANQEIWLGKSTKFICVDQPRFYIFPHPLEFRNV